MPPMLLRNATGTIQSEATTERVAWQIAKEDVRTMRTDIVPGAKFPDYELTDHTRQRRTLSELQGNDPMILVLSRGHYCPKDHQQHLELAAFYPRVRVSY